MKKYLFLIFIGALFLPLIARSVCDEEVNGKTGNEWCLEQPYTDCHVINLCSGDTRYHFGCQDSIISEDDLSTRFCGCYAGNSYFEECNNGCEDGACIEGSGEEDNGDGDNGDSTTTGASITLDNPLNADSFTDLIDGLINFIFYLGLAVAPIMFIVGGFVFLTSSGDPTKVAKGKNIMLYTAIGLAIVIAAKGLVLVLKDILGVKEEPTTYFKNLWFFGIISKEFLFQKMKIVKKSLKVGSNQ